jgi:hypothetical protein
MKRTSSSSKSSGSLFSKEQASTYKGEIFYAVNAHSEITEMIKDRHRHRRMTNTPEPRVRLTAKTHKPPRVRFTAKTHANLTDTPEPRVRLTAKTHKPPRVRSTAKTHTHLTNKRERWREPTPKPQTKGQTQKKGHGTQDPSPYKWRNVQTTSNQNTNRPTENHEPTPLVCEFGGWYSAEDTRLLPSKSWWVKHGEKWTEIMDKACHRAGLACRVCSHQKGALNIFILEKNSWGKGATYNAMALRIHASCKMILTCNINRFIYENVTTACAQTTHSHESQHEQLTSRTHMARSQAQACTGRRNQGATG